jgi:two-component system LytT family response regulator
MAMKTLIVDDEPNARQVIRNILEAYIDNVEVVGEAENVKEATEQINKLKPKLVLLDIHLPDGTGFDVVKAFKQVPFKFIIITAYEQYAIKAIKLSAIDYILKPINTQELIDAIEKVSDPVNEKTALLKLDSYLRNSQSIPSERRIVFNTADAVHAIRINDIIRCESDKNYSTIYLNNGRKLIVSKTLKEVDEMLSEYGFFRVHQSHLVNLHYFERYDKQGLSGNVVLSTGDKVPVSSRRKEGLMQVIMKM